ncbi:MAG: hypothetical protein IJ396_07110 [Oscillibacter sp.]|nr:hypothetical protein [Oscillibacter sp.]
MKRKSNWVVFILLCAIAAHFVLPQRAVKGEFRLYAVEENGSDLTERLDEADVESIESVVENALCARWRNPMGPYPAKGTVVLIGADDNGSCVVILAGSVGRYVVDDYNLRNGEAVWSEVVALLGESGGMT